MPRGKKMQTPSKQPEISSMNYEEEEEMQHDTSKLRDQVKQMSLVQKVIESKMDDLKKDVEAKMNDVEAKMDNLKIDLKTDLKRDMADLKRDLKTDLTNFLQEILTNGEKVVKETHDTNKEMLIMISQTLMWDQRPTIFQKSI